MFFSKKNGIPQFSVGFQDKFTCSKAILRHIQRSQIWKPHIQGTSMKPEYP